MSDALVERAHVLAAATVTDLINERAQTITVEYRQLLEHLASIEISAGGPMLNSIVKIGVDEVDLRANATLDAVKLAATTVGLHYSKKLTAQLRHIFRDLFGDQARLVELQMANILKTSPVPNAAAAEADGVAAIRWRVLRANGRARTDIEYFAESLRTTKREQRVRALWGAAGAVGGAAIAKAFDWIPGLIHH